jgi:hypothetical protein
MYKIVSIDDQIVINQIVDDYFVCLSTEYGYGFCGSFFSPRLPKLEGFQETKPFIFYDGYLSMEFYLRDLPNKNKIIEMFKIYQNQPIGIKIVMERIGECILVITQSRKISNIISKILTPLICYYPVHTNGLPYMNSSNIIDRYPMGFSGSNEFKPLIGFDDISYQEITIIDIDSKTIIREGQVKIEGFTIKSINSCENRNKFIVGFIGEGLDTKQQLIYKEKTFLIDFHRQFSCIKELFVGYYDLSDEGDSLEALQKLPKIIEEVEDMKVPFILFPINIIKTTSEIYHSLLVKRIRELTNDKTIVLPYPLCKL